MKKALVILAGIFGTLAILTAIVVILKRVRLKFTIDNTDDGFDFEDELDDDDDFGFGSLFGDDEDEE